MAERGVTEDIAVVGMGLMVVGASDPESYWHLLLAGANPFAPVPESRWRAASFLAQGGQASRDDDKTYSGVAGILAPAPPPHGDASGGRDPSVGWLRHAITQALAPVHLDPAEPVSCFIGYTPETCYALEQSLVAHGALAWLDEALAQAGNGESTALKAALKRVVLAHYAHARQLPQALLPHQAARDATAGLLPAGVKLAQLATVDTACSSGLYAIDLGVKQLLMGECGVAVCGGASSMAPLNSVFFSKLGGLSRRGDCRPFDASADGVLFSDGAAAVVLKRLTCAARDGDPILAVIKAFGGSSDGKGQAIYAPSPAGQRIALDQCHAHPAYDRERLGWIVAHATGTPAGDLVELSALGQTFSSGPRVWVSSNKACVGHTGWAAGVVSVIQAIVGLRKQLIPAQPRVEKPNEGQNLRATALRIPLQEQLWLPPADGPRQVGVSSFGFGGINGHLLLEEYVPGQPPSPAPERPLDARIAIVAWGALLPGLASRAAVSAWVSGAPGAAQPDASFGVRYPTPDFAQVKLSGRTLRSIDRAQIMVMQCGHQLREALGDAWPHLTARMGACMGHMGKLGHSIAYGRRAYLDDLQAALEADPETAASKPVLDALKRYGEYVRDAVPPINEDSCPGTMPNVIPARLASVFDLHGPTLTLDTGFGSTLSALDAACRYLRMGEVDAMIAGGVSGSTLPETEHQLQALLGRAIPAAEGVFLFVLTREEVATRLGLKTLGYVATSTAAATAPTLIPCGASARRTQCYLGAEGGLALLEALHALGAQPRDATPPGVDIAVQDEHGALSQTLRIEPPTAPAPPTHQAASDKPAPSPHRLELPPPKLLPAELLDASRDPQGTPLKTRRQVVALTPLHDLVVAEATPLFPPHTLVLTDQPRQVARLIEETNRAAALASGELRVLCVTPPPGHAPGFRHVAAVDEQAVAAALGPATSSVRHLRVLTDLGQAARPETALAQRCETHLRLLDLTFVALKTCLPALEQPGSTILGVAWNALTPTTGQATQAAYAPHPLSGLLGGMLSSVAEELPRHLVVTVLCETTDLSEAAAHAVRETTLQRIVPTVYVSGTRTTATTRRMSYLPREVASPLDTGSVARLDRDSVVVLVGGARGIAAEVAKALARYHQPKLYIIGSTRLDDLPSWVLEGSDETFVAGRRDFIAAELGRDPKAKVRDLVARHEQLYGARLATRTLQALRHLVGARRVHYFALDVRDEAAVTRAIQTIVAAEDGRIDLLVYVAGIDRSQTIAHKSLADFRWVRDVKLAGYQHFKHALQPHPPKMWCSFSSSVALVGRAGQIDYVAGNAFLNSAAAWAQAHGQDEFAIAWTLWSESGMYTMPGFRSLAKVYHQAGQLTLLPTAEGVHHFLRELHLPVHAPIVAHFGDDERAAFAERHPEAAAFLVREHAETETLADTSARPFGAFYVGRILSRTPAHVEIERVFDLTRDAYLTAHTVNGYATLPGAFYPELGAEAARVLHPDQVTVCVENLRLERYLRVYGPNRPLTVRIVADVAPDHDLAPGQTRIQVRVLSDAIAPTGEVLARDRLHASMDVLVAHAFPQAPQPALAAPRDALRSAVDPYHLPGAPIALHGVFVSTEQLQISASEKRGQYRRPVAPGDPVFAQLLLPCILLDGLFRLAVADDQPLLLLVAPRRIASLAFYRQTNDARLAQDPHGNPITLQVAGAFHPGPAHSGVVDRLVAVDALGQTLLEVRGLEGITVGYLDRATGQVLPPAEGQQRLAALPVPAAPLSHPEQTPPAPPIPVPEPALAHDAASATDSQTRLRWLGELATAFRKQVQQAAIGAPPATFEALVEQVNAPYQVLDQAGYDFFDQPLTHTTQPRVELHGRRLLLLSSYSYLGLLGHPRIAAAAKAAVDAYGTGTHGVRLLTGTVPLHRALEQRIAQFKGTQDAVLYASGYVANVATLAALGGKGDWIITDTLNHASIQDGAALSQAKVVPFQHGNLRSLELRLEHAQHQGGKRLVVVDAVYSMDGDVVDLPAVVALCKRYGAWVMIDEAHSTGVLGQTGRGIVEHFGLDPKDIQLHMGTFSKTIPSGGGYVAGKAEVIAALKRLARPFFFSAAMPPPQAAAALAAIDVIEQEPERLARLRGHIARYLTGLKQMGFDTLRSTTAIIPILCPSMEQTFEMARLCLEGGLLILPVVYPAVPLELPRLRTMMSAALSTDDVDFALHVLGQAGRQTGVIR